MTCYRNMTFCNTPCAQQDCHRKLTNKVGAERRRRIQLSMWAYAYEIACEPMVSDETFDAVALQSDPSIDTGRLDDWWRKNFVPYSGGWIHSHPELDALAARYRANRDTEKSRARGLGLEEDQ